MSEIYKYKIENCPFTDEAVVEAKTTSEGESLYVSFLQEKSSQDDIERLAAFKSDDEAYCIKGGRAYWVSHCDFE